MINVGKGKQCSDLHAKFAAVGFGSLNKLKVEFKASRHDYLPILNSILPPCFVKEFSVKFLSTYRFSLYAMPDSSNVTSLKPRPLGLDASEAPPMF